MRARSSSLLLIAVSVIWGSSWVANSVLSGLAPPVHLAVLRSGAAFLFLAVAWGALGKANVARRGWYWQSALLGCTMFAMPELLTLAAAEHGAAAFIPLVYAALPLGLSIAAGALRTPAILAMGAMLVLLNGSLSFTAGKVGWAMLIVVAVALQGWSLLYARAHLARVSTLRGCLTQAGAAMWVLVIWLRFRPESAKILPLPAWTAAPVIALCAVAGLGVAVAYPIYYRLLAKLEPEQLAISTWLQTLVAVAESAALLRQRPGWPMVCAAMVLVGCTAGMLRQAPSHAGGLRFLPGDES